MNKKDRELVIKNICANLPFGVMCKIDGMQTPMKLYTIQVEDENNVLLTFDHKLNDLPVQVYLSEVKPYLRPMKSMTDEEYAEYKDMDLNGEFGNNPYYKTPNIEAFYWLNAHYFDYNGLIEKGLALEAPDGMYN